MLQFNNKKKNSPSWKTSKGPEQTFLQRITHGQYAHEKVLHTSDHQDHSELPPPTTRTARMKKMDDTLFPQNKT